MRLAKLLPIEFEDKWQKATRRWLLNVAPVVTQNRTPKSAVPCGGQAPCGCDVELSLNFALPSEFARVQEAQEWAHRCNKCNKRNRGCPTEDKHIDVDNAPLWAHPLGHMCLPLIFTFGSWAAQIFAQTIHEWTARGNCYEEGNPESHCAQHDANCTNSFTLVLSSTTAQFH